MIGGVKFCSIPVSDQQVALEFYTEKLGFTVKTDVPMGPDNRWIELAIPGADTYVVLFTPPGHEDRIGTFQHVVFWTEDLEATYQELLAKGVKFTQPPKKEEWGSSAFLEDPDGNKLLITQEG